MMSYFLKKKSFHAAFTILTVVMQITVASSLSPAQATLKSSGSISNAHSSSVTRPLHIEGNRIRNDIGEIVYLRGWNKAMAAESKEFSWGGWKRYLQSNVDLTFDRLKYYGANTMRVLITFSSWVNNYPTPSESGTIGYREAIDDMLIRAEQRGIYIIICPYSIYPKDCPVHGFGGCNWQDVMGYDPWTNDGHEGIITNASQFTNVIVDMVDKLGSHKNLIIEFYNEPWCTAAGSYYANLWQSVWQNTISAARQKEAEKGYINHLIIVQLTGSLRYTALSDPCSNFNWYWTNPLNDSANSLVYSMHCYRYHGSVGYQNPITIRPYSYEEIKRIYQEEKVEELSKLVPILIGEIGAHIPTDNKEPTGTEYLWMQNSLRIFNEWGMSYLGWCWWGATQWAELEAESETSTGGTVNKYGQLIVDAIKQGSA